MFQCSGSVFPHRSVPTATWKVGMECEITGGGGSRTGQEPDKTRRPLDTTSRDLSMLMLMLMLDAAKNSPTLRSSLLWTQSTAGSHNSRQLSIIL
jgi:hypothetical protein